MLTRTTAFAIGLAICTAAAAQNGDDDRTAATAQVTYGDLDLGSASSQAILQHRIQAAAGHVCDVGGMQTMDDFAAYSRCYTAAYADGMRQVSQLMAARATGAVMAASAIVVASR